MKITALIENHSRREGIVAQYGLSLLLQTAHGHVLVDAGQNEDALNNFFALGYDPSIIDSIVISHNHFDHIGGLQHFLDATAHTNPPVYVSGGIGQDLYTKQPFSRKKLCSRNDLIANNYNRIRFVSNSVQILPDVFVCTIANPSPDFVCKDRKLRMLSNTGRLVRDNFHHEVYITVIEDKKLKLISSCSHNGIVNIIQDAVSRFQLPVTAFVGGLHLRGRHHDSLNCSRSYVAQLIDALNSLSLPTIYTCHCTGALGYQLLQDGFNGAIYDFHSGDSFSL